MCEWTGGRKREGAERWIGTKNLNVSLSHPPELGGPNIQPQSVGADVVKVGGSAVVGVKGVEGE